MRVLSLLLLGIMAMYPFMISSIYKYAFPNEVYQGSKSSTLLLLITSFLVICGVITVFLPGKGTNKNQTNKLKNKWLLFIGGVFLVLFSFFSATFFWYSPTFQILGFDEPAPLTGVICFLILSLLSVIILDLSSKYGSKNHPNLMRILVVNVSFLASFLTVSLALILLYAFPSVSGSISYPSAATYCFMSFIVWGVLILKMNKEKIDVSKPSV